MVSDSQCGVLPEGERIAQITANMLTFGMGASSMALFARVGGGIFTKAADVGAAVPIWWRWLFLWR